MDTAAEAAAARAEALAARVAAVAGHTRKSGEGVALNVAVSGEGVTRALQAMPAAILPRYSSPTRTSTGLTGGTGTAMSIALRLALHSRNSYFGISMHPFETLFHKAGVPACRVGGRCSC